MTSLASIVLVVRDLDHALALYEVGLGFVRAGSVEDVPSLGARRIILQGESVRLELLEPHDDSKPPGLFLEARGEGVFALTIGVDDLGRTRERLERVGIAVLGLGAAGPPAPRTFIRPRDAHGLLVEVAPGEVAEGA